MLSYSTRNKLAEFLLEVNEGERQIEVVRQILCEQEDFEPYAAFRRIDRNKIGFLTSHNIQKFLSDNKIDRSEKHCQLYITRYDTDNDGQLSYPEFLQSFLTLENATLRTVATQRPNYTVGPDKFLSYDIEYALSKIIDQEIQLYINLDDKKSELLNFHDFNFPNAFAVIDRDDVGNINYDNLKTFLKNQSIFPGDEEIIAILRRLDKNDDALISFEEFVQAIEPFSEALRATANRRNASVKFESPSRTNKMLTHSPLRTEASRTLRQTASPSRIIPPNLKLHHNTSDDRFSAYDTKLNYSLRSPTSRREASPTRKEASPTRKEASPTRKEASPTRRVSSPRRKEASPYRKEASPTRLTYNEKSYNELKRDISPINMTDSPLTPLKDDSQDVSLMNTSKFKEGNFSLRKAQIYKDFPRNQTCKSPDASPSKNSNNNSRHVNRLTASWRGDGSQSPEKKSSLSGKQTNISRTMNRSVKKGLNFDNEINHFILIQTLKQFVVLDKDLETAKQDVSLKSDFNLLDFFRTFDITSHTTISFDQFLAGMVRYSIYPNKEDLQLVFNKMDLDKDGLLRFSDFAETFTPKQKEYANLVNNRTPAHTENVLDIQSVFSPDTKSKIVAVLRLLLENETSSESLRQRLKSKSEISTHESFEYLDLKADGSITADELIDVFKKNDTFLTDREIKLLMDRLDQDKDGRVTYFELLEAISPKVKV